jgi:hypothetical protein
VISICIRQSLYRTHWFLSYINTDIIKADNKCVQSITLPMPSVTRTLPASHADSIYVALHVPI